MILLPDFLRSSGPCGRYNVGPIENPLSFIKERYSLIQSPSRYHFWGGWHKSDPFSCKFMSWKFQRLRQAEFLSHRKYIEISKISFWGAEDKKKSSFCHQVSTMKCCKSATVVFANLYYELICISLPQIFPPKFDHHPIFGVHAYLWFKYVKVEEAFVQLGVDFF